MTRRTLASGRTPALSKDWHSAGNEFGGTLQLVPCQATVALKARKAREEQRNVEVHTMVIQREQQVKQLLDPSLRDKLNKRPVSVQVMKHAGVWRLATG